MNQSVTRAAPVGEQAAALRLAQRLLARPALRQRVEGILDVADRDVQNGCTADEAEAHVRELTRALAHEVLQDWASTVATHVTTQALARNPALIRHTKKKSTGTPPSARSR